MPRAKSSHYPKYVYAKSGQLYQIEARTADSDNESRRKHGSSTKRGKGKLSFESDSDEMPPKKTMKRSIVSKKKKPTMTKKVTSGSSKKKPQPPAESSESEMDSAEETQQRLTKAKEELLAEQEMKVRTEKEMEKKYKACKAFVKKYEKQHPKNKDSELPLWQQASKMMTDSAATLVKYNKLQNAKIDPNSHLVKAIPKLGEYGQTKYREATEIVSKLTDEDREKFWCDQVRNKDAKCFEDLITKKQFERRRITGDMSTVAPVSVTTDATTTSSDPSTGETAPMENM